MVAVSRSGKTSISRRTLAEADVPLRAEDVMERPDGPIPPFVPPIVRAEDVMDHPDDPLPDPPQRVDMQQELNVRDPITMLQAWMANKGREKVLITGEAFLCEATAPPGDTRMVRPDCMVGFGITHAELLETSNGWIVSERGYPPAFALEVASESTGRRDYTHKRDVYMRLRVPEIFRFDATSGRYHDAPLGGDRLVDGEYVSVPVFDCPEYAGDGALHVHSEVLELDICWHEGRMRYYDPAGGAHLRNIVETDEARRAAEARAETAEARLEDSDSENRRLRELLGERGSPSP